MLFLLHFSVPEFVIIQMIKEIIQGLIGGKIHLVHSALKNNLCLYRIHENYLSYIVCCICVHKC